MQGRGRQATSWDGIRASSTPTGSWYKASKGPLTLAWWVRACGASGAQEPGVPNRQRAGLERVRARG